MALVIENGSLVAGANSYVTVAEVRAFASARASNLPADDSEGDLAIEAACIVASDYLESLRDQYKGSKVDGSQDLQFPRLGVSIDGVEVESTTIPQTLKNAQCQLVIESTAGTDLTPSSDGREIVKEKIDVLEREYAPGSNAAQPVLVKVNNFLAPLLKSSGGGLQGFRI